MPSLHTLYRHINEIALYLTFQNILLLKNYSTIGSNNYSVKAPVLNSTLIAPPIVSSAYTFANSASSFVVTLIMMLYGFPVIICRSIFDSVFCGFCYTYQQFFQLLQCNIARFNIIVYVFKGELYHETILHSINQ